MESENSSALDVNGATEVFADLLEPKEPQAEAPADAELESPEIEAEAESQSELEADPEAQPEETETYTVKIDGKEVEVSLDELKNGYQRQADYTKKTTEAAELRKQADAQIQAAQQERAQYAQTLQEQAVILNAAILEQQQINWQQLLDTDPLEYLRQRDLLEKRQQALQSTQIEWQNFQQRQQAEEAQSRDRFVKEQQAVLLAKFPEWNDEAKAKAEHKAIRDHLKTDGYSDQEIASILDARHVMTARKAMLYDQMMAKAQATAKKVAGLPPKVERPGVSEVKGTDKRSQAFQRLSKSGTVEDAAAVFSSLL